MNKAKRVPVGFELSSLQFRAQSFYTQSAELSDYFAARQWYASVVFRLSNPRETAIAVMLAEIIHGQPELLAGWKQLSDPFDDLLAKAEDGTVPIYAEAAKAGGPAAVQKALEATVPAPRVNDQQLQPTEYRQFSQVTRGFRLLPSRRLPCAVCFQETVDPVIAHRMHPTGLDFMAASPEMRSPAAIRALKDQFGKSVADAIVKTDCGPMPDSLHGDAMRLLAKLQEPLPDSAPPAMRTAAWSDREL